MRIALRPYQVRAIEAARAHVLAGRRRICIASPTGSGKTTMFAAIAANHVAQGGHVLVLAHRQELVDQARARIADFHGLARVETVQALLARGERPPCTLLILDECHHYASDEWSNVADHYRDALVVGLTATPERGDGRGLEGLFDAMVTVAQPRELIDAGHLVPVDVVRPKRLMPGRTLCARPVDAWQEHTPGRKTIVFAPSVKLAEEMAEDFGGERVARVVHGKMNDVDRAMTLDAFERNVFPVLVNVFVLTEGYDCPDVEVCVLARGAGTPGTYLQMVGRVMRPAMGKTQAWLLDLTGTSHLHGPPDIDRVYSLRGKAIRAADAPDVRFCQVCGGLLEEGPCAACGTESSGEYVLRVRPEPMVRYARKREESEDARVFTLVRWLKQGRERGFKSGWAYVKYRAVYGENAPASVSQEAERRLAALTRGAA